MILLTLEEICNIHKEMMDKTTGFSDIRDISLLESSVGSMYAGFENVEKYPTLLEKVSRLTFSLIKNHGFIDGNKRIGILALVITLDINHIPLYYTQSDLVDLGLKVADGTFQYKDVLEWVSTHIETKY